MWLESSTLLKLFNADWIAGRKVLAVDLCGEPSANAPEAECSAASLVNQKLYGALAAKIED